MSLGSHAKPDASKWVVLAPPLPHRHCRVHRNGQHLRLCQLHAPGTGLSKGESPGKSTSHHLANQPPSAAVTNDHKLSGLKLHKWVPHGSIGQRSEVGPSNLRSMCPPGLSSSGGFRGQSLSSPFPGPRGHSHSLAPGPVSFGAATLHLCEHPFIDTSPF